MQLSLEGDRAGLRRLYRDVAQMNRSLLRAKAPRVYLIENLGASVRKASEEGRKTLVGRATRTPAAQFEYRKLDAILGF